MIAVIMSHSPPPPNLALSLTTGAGKVGAARFTPGLRVNGRRSNPQSGTPTRCGSLGELVGLNMSSDKHGRRCGETPGQSWGDLGRRAPHKAAVGATSADDGGLIAGAYLAWCCGHPAFDQPRPFRAGQVSRAIIRLTPPVIKVGRMDRQTDRALGLRFCFSLPKSGRGAARWEWRQNKGASEIHSPSPHVLAPATKTTARRRRKSLAIGRSGDVIRRAVCWGNPLLIKATARRLDKWTAVRTPK